MKHLFHIATGNFEFIEEEFTGTVEEAIDAYKALTEAYRGTQNPSEGLISKDFDKALDRYLCGNGMDSEAYAAMNKEQVDRIQMVKRAFARIKNRQDK